MTQGTPIAETGDRVVVGPGWIIRATGVLGLFGGLSLSLLLIFSGELAVGLFLTLATLILLPFLAILMYTIWRFYWQILAAALGLLTIGMLVAWLSIEQGRLSLPEQWIGLTLIIKRSNAIGVFMSVVLGALGAAAIYRIYMLWRSGELGRLRDRLMHSSSEPLFNFDISGPSSGSAANLPLGDRVLTHLQKTGHRGERQGDLIHVYKQRDFVGIVRVVESAGAISPILVRDVEKQRSKLGVKVAYLATAGWFTDEVRSMADQMGVKLITV